MALALTPDATPLVLSHLHRLALQPYLPAAETAGSNSLLEADKLPHVTLTYAMSLDAQISLAPGVQTRLSGPETKAMTHFLRASHDAILVGVGTAEADDPSLNCRYSEDGQNPVGFEDQPIPIILDPGGRWLCNPDVKVVQLARSGRGKPPMWIMYEANARTLDTVRRSVIEGVGGTIISIASSANYNWTHVLGSLGQQGIQSVMVEGGGRIIEDLLRTPNQSLIGSVIITIAPVWLGQGGVTTCPGKASSSSLREVGRLKDVKWLQMGQDAVMAGTPA